MWFGEGQRFVRGFVGSFHGMATCRDRGNPRDRSPYCTIKCVGVGSVREVGVPVMGECGVCWRQLKSDKKVKLRDFELMTVLEVEWIKVKEEESAAEAGSI